MLKKRDEGPTPTWVVEVPAQGTFFTLVSARDAAEARKLAREADEWFTREDLEPGNVGPTSKAFIDASGSYQRAADEARDDDDDDDDEADDDAPDDDGPAPDDET